MSLRVSGGVLLGVAVLIAPGCGKSIEEPEVAPVKGKVTLDGQPADSVMVQFSPIAGPNDDTKKVGAPSTALTDAEGNYELTYKEGLKGAVIGMHGVRVMRPEAFEPNPDGSVPSPQGPPIPEKYWIDSPLKEEVQAGENVINIELTTK